MCEYVLLQRKSIGAYRLLLGFCDERISSRFNPLPKHQVYKREVRLYPMDILQAGLLYVGSKTWEAVCPGEHNHMLEGVIITHLLEKSTTIQSHAPMLQST